MHQIYQGCTASRKPPQQMSNNNRDPTKDLSGRTTEMSTKDLYITLSSFHPTSRKQGQSSLQLQQILVRRIAKAKEQSAKKEVALQGRPRLKRRLDQYRRLSVVLYNDFVKQQQTLV